MSSHSEIDDTFITSGFIISGRLWLWGRASVLSSEDHWFDPPGLHVKVSLGKILNPQTAPDVLVGTSHGSHRHQ